MGLYTHTYTYARMHASTHACTHLEIVILLTFTVVWRQFSDTMIETEDPLSTSLQFNSLSAMWKNINGI